MLRGKHIVVGISGGIAAYKTPLLIRLLIKAGAEVRVCATRHALNFVTELTLQTLSGYDVYTDMFNRHGYNVEHISLAQWADLVIVAPATANIIGKMACGIGDDELSTLLLATRCPVLIAPAMNTNMLHHPSVENNLSTLRSRQGIYLMPSPMGALACGTEGDGRMAEPEQIFSQADRLLEPQTLQGVRIMLTVGPTKEPIDPVRYISNHSTGKMGYAIATLAAKRGAQVTVLSGEVAPQIRQQAELCDVIDTPDAQTMYHEAVSRFSQADVAILCAAVADYTPAHVATEKIKRKSGENLILELQPTHDIAARLGELKKPQQLMVGFALETQDEMANAQKKLQRKNLDMIVLNSLRDEGAGFGFDTNKVSFIYADHTTDLPLMQKTQVAEHLLDAIAQLLAQHEDMHHQRS